MAGEAYVGRPHKFNGFNLDGIFRIHRRHGLGISRDAINKRRVQGKLKARICNDHGQWLYWLPEPTPVSNEKVTNISSTAGDAV